MGLTAAKMGLSPLRAANRLSDQYAFSPKNGPVSANAKNGLAKTESDHYHTASDKMGMRWA